MKAPRQISDKFLAPDFNEAAHNSIRELAMACRKASIYGANHPMTSKAAEKPFLELDWLFRYRRFVHFYLIQGHLFVMNFRLKDSVFTEEIIRYMQLLEVRSLMFERTLTAGEFCKFLDRFVTRVNINDPKNGLEYWLTNNKIPSIKINSEEGVHFFEDFKQYRGDVSGDFSAKTILMQTLGDDPVRLADFLVRGEAALADARIDFDLDIILYLLPERIAALKIKDIQAAIKNSMPSGDAANPSERTRALLRLTDYHPEKNAILQELNLDQPSKPAKVSTGETGKVDILHNEAFSFIERTISILKEDGAYTDSVATFASSFTRMLRTGQKGKANQTLLELIDMLSSAQPRTRQTALDLLLASIETVRIEIDEPVYQTVVQRISDKINWKDETFEYSALIWALFRRTLAEKQYTLLTVISSALNERKKLHDGVTEYDSIAVKQVFENLNRPEVISALVDDLVKADHAHAQQIRSVLTTIGSEEVASALSEIISHPIRQVRQGALKVLSELGKGALVVFSRMLSDNNLFQRSPDRHELPDAKWFIVRNSIFVLGSLRDQAGIAPLRQHVSDQDVRVRREIISALEKIGADSSVDVLCLMADDTDREIRESAIAALGIIGEEEAVPLLIDIARRHPETILRIIGAVSRIGGEDARNYLGQLLNSDSDTSAIAGSGLSKDDLHLAAVKGLAHIGDTQAIERIRGFHEKLSGAQKLLFRNSELQRMLSEILSKR